MSRVAHIRQRVLTNVLKLLLMNLLEIKIGKRVLK